jgi:hypothetical protein
MSTPPGSPPKRSIASQIKDYIAGAVGATRSRVDDFSAEVEHRAFRLLWMIVWGVVGTLSLGLAVAFAMLTVIFGFGLPPKYAFGIPALVFLLVGMAAAVMFQRAKSSRRGPR